MTTGTPHSEVVSITGRNAYRPNFKGIVAEQIRAARHKSGKSPAEFAAYLSDLTGRKITERMLAEYEKRGTFTADVLSAATADGAGLLPELAGDSLDQVPHGFPAAQLAGDWVTSYEFSHDGRPHHHADIAHVTVTAGGLLRASNHPPEPRTEGRARPFRNEITGRLAGRHLVGTWRNTSDARYFGSVHLAVRAGEVLMDGWYTGLASDVEISLNRWRWVRLDSGELPADALARLVLHDPAAVYESVMSHQFDAPMALDDIGKVA